MRGGKFERDALLIVKDCLIAARPPTREELLTIGNALEAACTAIESPREATDLRFLLTPTALDDIVFAAQQCEGSEVGARLLWLWRELGRALSAREAEKRQTPILNWHEVQEQLAQSDEDAYRDWKADTVESHGAKSAFMAGLSHARYLARITPPPALQAQNEGGR